MKRADAAEGPTVVITGGSGFVGSNLARAYVESGARVTIVDNGAPGTGANPENLKDIRDRVTVLQTSCGSAEVKVPLQEGAVVLHCAALTSHTASMSYPVRTMETNVGETVQLLDMIRRSGCDITFINVGTTSQAYDLAPSTQSEVLTPTEFYSLSKEFSEREAIAHRELYGMNVACVRLPNTYGPRACISNPALGFINYFIGLGLLGNEIPVFGEGRQIRWPLFVDDAVKVIMGAADGRWGRDRPFSAYGPEPLSVMEIARSIEREIGGSVRKRPWPEENERVETGDAIVGDVEAQSSDEIGARVPLADGLRRARDFYLARLERYMVNR